ncbi:hypothetical protein PV326_008913 [Microctonus aethiopoides]|nr:hypothetical protein PV326_008913 [Microctonus aethiopoides]
MAAGPIAERNQDATIYVGGLDDKVAESLMWELFVQSGPVVNVHMPKDRVTQMHQGYGFVEFMGEEDADYAIKIMNMIKLYEVDEKLLYDTFSAFGVILQTPKIMRDPETGNSKGFAFINFASFDASDASIEAMNGQYLCNRPISVSYAFKRDAKGERHGSAAERLLAAQNPLSQADRPHQLFADAPPLAPMLMQNSSMSSSHQQNIQHHHSTQHHVMHHGMVVPPPPPPPPPPSTPLTTMGHHHSVPPPVPAPPSAGFTSNIPAPPLPPMSISAHPPLPPGMPPPLPPMPVVPTSQNQGHRMIAPPLPPHWTTHSQGQYTPAAPTSSTNITQYGQFHPPRPPPGWRHPPPPSASQSSTMSTQPTQFRPPFPPRGPPPPPPPQENSPY